MISMPDGGLSGILQEDHPAQEQEKIKEKVKEIQEETGRKLILYLEHPDLEDALIKKKDAMGFEDVLRPLDEEKGDLLINSSGGMPDAAEKILITCRSHFSEEFNTIVPDYAKSAATMITLGSDEIIMGHNAELGPIDPQIPTEQGLIPAQAFLSGLEYVRDNIKKEENPDPLEMYVPMLNKINLQILQVCENSIEHSRELAENWLKDYMLSSDHSQAEETAKKLSEGIEYNSHGKVIDPEEASNELGLNIDKLDKNSDLWEQIWDLYCRSWKFLQTTDSAKIFVSEERFLSQHVETKNVEEQA